LKNLRGSMLVFHYEVVRPEDNTLLAEGETTHIVVNSQFEKTNLPQNFASAFGAAVKE
jgi:acyl-CoA thioester hydrolase